MKKPGILIITSTRPRRGGGAWKFLYGLFLGLALTTSVAFSQALLEDFSSVRNSVGGGPLWNVYNGDPACTGQTWSVASGAGNDSVPSGPGNYCPYMHFFPDGSTYGYRYPWGYAQYYLLSGTWSTSFNRLTFTMNCSNGFTQGSDGFATYIRDHASTDPSYQGQHYYHGFAGVVTANQRVSLVYNDHPTHRVGGASNINWPRDPEWVFQTQSNPTHYFDGLTRFYVNPTRLNLSPAYTCSYKDFNFSQMTGEPDEYVYTVSAAYNGAGYNVDWLGPKWDNTTYEVRYSTSGSLKTAGFSSGTSGGPDVTTPGSAYNDVHWVSPAMPQAANIWIAIRPKPQVKGATGNGVSPIRISTANDIMLSNGDQVSISGVIGNAAANGTWPVAAVPRQFWRIDNGTLSQIQVTAGTPNTATVTTSAPHNLRVGQVVVIWLYGDTNEWAYGNSYTVTQVPSSTTFTVATGEPAGTYTSSSLDVWSLPAIDLTGSTGNGTYVGGGTVAATSQAKNFTEIHLAGAPGPNPCDINGDGVVNSIDVQLATNQSLGLATCTADLDGDGRCDVIDVQRVINAATGGACRVGP